MIQGEAALCLKAGRSPMARNGTWWCGMAVPFVACLTSASAPLSLLPEQDDKPFVETLLFENARSREGALPMFQKKEDRFLVKSREGFQGGDLVVLVDKQTGVNYVSFVGLGAATFTPLVDRDGKPLTDSLPLENL